ncbi:Ribosome-recycling factor-like [Homarus americanus]|uniref:Ribosome-recycling factor, mitochondrial n=1 Tax=Homarus americanus TaxID=6706 RepID=A0A8J5TLB1_HOMAM|nr:Ribosome-recycling factor-like [Homarus americanus]
MALSGSAAAGRVRLMLPTTWSVWKMLSSVSYRNLSGSAAMKYLNVPSPPRSLYPTFLAAPSVTLYKKTKVHLSDEEMSEVLNVTHMRNQFSETVENLKQDYIKNLSLRTSAGSIENLSVQLEGDEYPLNEVAQVSRKSSHMLVINASAFPQALTGIIKAIQEAGMNLNPQQEGTTLYVPLPKVTKEHRENLAKNAKTLYNRCKDQLRETQNQYIRKAKRKEGQVSEDLIHDVQQKVREIAESHMQEAEKMMSVKQKELLKTN